jgi:hypothetical protein
VIAYVRHRHRRELAGVMVPQSQIVQPSYGTIVDADIEAAEIEPADTPNIQP